MPRLQLIMTLPTINPSPTHRPQTRLNTIVHRKEKSGAMGNYDEQEPDDKIHVTKTWMIFAKDIDFYVKQMWN